MRERKTTGGHTTVSLSEMRANSRCETKFFCGSLTEVSNPSVILFSDGPAARLLLQKTEAVLAGFPEIRVKSVNKSAATVSKTDLRVRGGAFVGILATSRAGGIAGWQARLGPNPLIVVPVPKSPADGLRLLQAVTEAGCATVALGEAGARNAALLAVAIIATNGAAKLRKSLDVFRGRQTATVRRTRLPSLGRKPT